MVLAKGLEKAIENIYGKNMRIESRQPVFGGDINRAYAKRPSVLISSVRPIQCDHRKCSLLEPTMIFPSFF